MVWSVVQYYVEGWCLRHLHQVGAIKQQAWKKLIYQVFQLLGTNTANIGWSSYSKDYVSSIKGDISISLCNTVLENSMHDTVKLSVNAILTSLNGIFNEDTTVSGIDPAEEISAEEILEAGWMNELADTDEDALCPPTSKKFSKKKIHKLMWKDPWAEGRKKFLEKDAIFVCAEVARRLPKKSRIRSFILNGSAAMNSKTSSLAVGEELGIKSPFQLYTRSRVNNLNLR